MKKLFTLSLITKPYPKSYSSHSPMLNSLFTISLFITTLSAAPDLSRPTPVGIQPFLANPTPPATIPAFPEQSNLAGCHLNLPEQFFHSVKSACAGSASNELRRGRCCPVLATWLYSAYSSTALSRHTVRNPSKQPLHPAVRGDNSTVYDMPLLPDDSETCVGEVDKALRRRGIELQRPNATCDVVYCFCGIRLHTLTCADSFSVNGEGKLVGDRRVKRLERDCLAHSDNVNGFPGLGGCAKCLHSLRRLNIEKALNTRNVDERTTKMHNKDCEMMGLTWLLAKNRTAYMHTVSAVIRAIMMSPDGANHHDSCALSSDGLPLAVDSSEIFSDKSSSVILRPLPVSLFVALASLLYIQIHCLVNKP